MRFKGLDKTTQDLIMQKGSLDSVRDPTAVLMSRMNNAEAGTLELTGSSQQPQNGDWYCQGCNDLQFRRNQQCRKCGTPNPGDGGIQGQPKGMGKGGKPMPGNGAAMGGAPQKGGQGDMAQMMQMMQMMQ